MAVLLNLTIPWMNGTEKMWVRIWDEVPPLNEMIGMMAGLGGFLGRKGDGFPGPQTIWIGLQRTRDFVLAMDAQRIAIERCG